MTCSPRLAASFISCSKLAWVFQLRAPSFDSTCAQERILLLRTQYVPLLAIRSSPSLGVICSIPIPKILPGAGIGVRDGSKVGKTDWVGTSVNGGVLDGVAVTVGRSALVAPLTKVGVGRVELHAVIEKKQTTNKTGKQFALTPCLDDTLYHSK